ncbi:flagellar type III secretion system pore protein FliP [Pandoraea pulmonicola]|uniref:Flagellar biosynthetic protein FliP n=1 Tax=Pandoraea pulmonicola TaxID=93221 RepID=A0AAJ5CZX7_PANPU|nr:flagellar type III secretion system pore protein FliP [Pandoraea pulmonicola]AJC21211.1 flagellar biosynthetic protein FliP [Pandoraea pulmonicola]SUA90109.1 Flagellar biosynthetic protein fliP precursor [Pandoraea pulmonicola]
MKLWTSRRTLGAAALVVAALLSMPATAEPLTLPAEALGMPRDFSPKTQILLFMTLLGLLPALVMVMTSFVRFVIVLALLRQALGLQQGLPSRVITGVALLLTLLVMRPVGVEIWNNAIEPFDQDKITFREAMAQGEKPLSRFMLAQTSKASLSQVSRLSNETDVAKPEDHSFIVKAAAFSLSELKTAFQVGAMLFVPFLVIDLVVASVLMAMGMMMLSPLVISLPLKLLLFVMIDGWTLTVNTLATSIRAF